MSETSAGLLADAGFEIAKREGLKALTARRLAAEVGGSSSSVTYHYGTMDEMRLQVSKQVHAELARWRHQWRVSAADGLGSVTVAGFVNAAVTDLARERRGLTVLAAEIANSGDFPEFLKQEREATAFWSTAFEQLGCASDAAVTWTDFVYGLTPLACIDGNPQSLMSWLPLLVQRLDDRMAGRPSFEASRFPFPPFPETLPPAPATSGAQRILQATIEVLGDRGAEKLTHRDVAKRAGLSPAAATYFFETKSDMIIAAVQEISRRAHERMHEPGGEMTTSRTVIAPDGRLHTETRASLMLYSSVVRNPELQEVGRALRDLRGPIAMERVRQASAEVDRVDALLWATILQGVMHPCRMPRRNVEKVIEARTALHRANLFPKRG